MTRYKFKKHLNYFHSIGFDTWISFVFILGCYFFPYSSSQVQRLLCIIMHFPSPVPTSMKFLHFRRSLPRLRLGKKINAILNSGPRSFSSTFFFTFSILLVFLISFPHSLFPSNCILLLTSSGNLPRVLYHPMRMGKLIVRGNIKRDMNLRILFSLMWYPYLSGFFISTTEFHVTSSTENPTDLAHFFFF